MAKSSTRILLYMLKFMTADAATSPSSEEFHPPKTGTAEMLSAILEEVSPSHPVRDGDCDIVAARVTAAVREHGIAAETVTVSGWSDPHVLRTALVGLTALAGIDDRKILGFAHHVTLAEGWVMDATAQQFNPDLPSHWVAPVKDYLSRLAAAAGVATATLATTGP